MSIKKPGGANNPNSNSNIDQNPLDAIMENSSANGKVSNNNLIFQQNDRVQDQEMQDESKKEEYDLGNSKMSRSSSNPAYGSAQSRPSSYLQNTESKIKILESKSNKTLKVAWNPSNHLLAFGGDNESSSLWNLDDNVSHAQLVSVLPHVTPDLLSSSLTQNTTTINSIDWKPDGNNLITGASDGI